MSQISIPRNTANASLGWGQTFVAGIEAAPGTYFVDAATVAQLRTLVDAYQVSFDAAGVISNIAVDPANYTQPQRAQLATDRTNFLALASQVAVQIQANNGVSDANKLAIGVVPRNFTRTPVPAPSSMPVLDITVMTSGLQQLAIADFNTPNSTSKPAGVTASLLYLDITDVGTPGVFANAQLYGVFTKTPVQVSFDPGDNGKLATFWSQWVNRKGDAGPVSASVSGVISFVS